MRRIAIGFGVVALAAATSVSLIGQDRPGQTPSGQDRQGQAPPGAGTQRPTDSPQRPTDGTRPTDTTPRPSERTGAAQSDSRSFVNDMAVAGMAEVQLGKLASERAASSDVKSFGQMMVKDHSKANDELKKVASQMNIQLPTQLDQKHRDLADKLSKLTGAEFDREYAQAMVQGHQEVLSKLQARSGNRAGTDRAGAEHGATDHAGAATGSANDARGEQALTQWAANTAPAVQQHLERARQMQQKVSGSSGAGSNDERPRTTPQGR